MKTLTRIKIIQFSMLTTLVRGIIQILGKAVTNLQGQCLKQYLDSKSMHKVYYNNMLSKYYQWKKCSCSLCKVNNNICKLNRNICILNSSSCKVNKLLWEFENQIEQLASTLNNRTPRKLSNDTQVPRQDVKECKVVELKTGKELFDHTKHLKLKSRMEAKGTDEESEDGWVEVQKPDPQPTPLKYVRKLPNPWKQQRIKEHHKFLEFLNIS